MTASILVVEDNENQREFLERLLLDVGFSVHTAADGTNALKSVEKVHPDLVILDLGLPDIKGETVFSEMRKDYPDLPIILLTARGSSSDIVGGFSLGADDYVTKPYDADELLARVKARISKHMSATPTVKVADLVLNTKTLEVIRSGRKITLTPKEFKLLEYLMVNRDQVLSREMILSRIWLYAPDMETRAVDVYIGYLRKKIDSGFGKKLIQSVRGYGYMIRE